jgi:hypothetical protein
VESRRIHHPAWDPSVTSRSLWRYCRTMTISPVAVTGTTFTQSDESIRKKE